MMLWTIIRDWFVQYVFGGMDSSGTVHSVFIGSAWAPRDADFTPVYGESLWPWYGNAEGEYGTAVCPWVEDGNLNPLTGLSFSDWLSTTATIIVLCALSFVLFLGVKWIFKVFVDGLSRIGK